MVLKKHWAPTNSVLVGQVRQTERYDNSTMPWVVFTDPQVAGVGLTARQARKAGFEVKTSLIGLENVPRALAARDTRGLIKLVANAKTDRLLGGVIMVSDGADSVQTLAMALRFGMTATALGEMIFPYLTTVEGLKLTAQSFDRDVATLSCCAGLPDRLAATQRRDLMEIVEERYGRSATVITSQLPITACHYVIGEPTVADAILSRIVHNAYRLEIEGASMRKTSANMDDEKASNLIRSTCCLTATRHW